MIHHWPAINPASGLPPLLLVHGAFAGASLWRERFAPAWASSGIDTWAMEFSTQRDGPLKRQRRSLSDFCCELSEAIDSLPTPPVVLGYSLGGRVVQELTHTRRLKGIVLLNALPGQGVASLLLSYARRHPISLAMLMSLAVASPVRRLSRKLPAGIASQYVDADQKDRYIDTLRGESLLALTECLLPMRQAAKSIPTLVIGMSGDALIPPSVARRSAGSLGADLILLDGLSHTPMIEPGGEQVVHAVTAWLKNIKPVD